MRMIAKITSFTLLLSMVTIASSDPVACRLVEVFVSCPHGDCPPEPNQGFRCIDDDGLDRDLVGLESDFFTKPWHYGRKPQSGDILHASSGGKRKGNNRNEFVVDSGSTVSVEEGRRPSRGNVFGNGNGNRNGNSLRSGTRRRDLAAEEEYPTQLTGDSSVLLVYVTADNGAAPTLSKERFFDEVFAADNFNLVSRYNACSNNQLRFAPAVNASDGVSGTEAVEVHLNQDIAGMGRRAVETLVDDYIIANHGWLDLVTGFDHLMYIFPSVVDFLGANAYALGFGGRKSVYNDQSGAYIGVQSHELGHNLGLRHSGEDGVVYGDRTCLMGQTFGTMANFESPRMCFNGAKSWYLGWYSAGHQEVTGGFEGQLQLVGIDDYNNGLFSASAGDRVVLKIPHISDNTLDLYVMYNRKKGVNDETQEYQNEVVIVQSPPDQAAESWSIAHLSAGESYSSRGHGYDGSALVLSVDSISEEAVGTKDFATVTISYDFSPTASPTSCPIDDDFRLEFKSDQFPVDTSWDIVDSNDVMVASATSYSKAFFISEEEYCLEGTPPYTFTFNDQHGDGLTAGNAANPADANGNVGYFRIFYAGSEVQTEMATLGQFNTYSVSFGSAPSPTPSPVTPSPVTPSPVTPSPVTPSPVTQSPVTPSPVTPAPTPSPVTPSPVTPSPITPSPVTSSPVTPDPTPSPVTPSPVTPSPVTPEPTPSPVATPAPIVTPAPVTLRSVTKYFCQKSLASQDQCEDPGLSQSCGSDGIKGICSRGSKCRHLTCTTGGPDPTPSPVPSPTPSPVSSPTPSPVSNPTPSPVSNPTPSPVTVVTPNPVNTCAVKNGFCTRDSDCCSLDCNTGRRKCKL